MQKTNKLLLVFRASLGRALSDRKIIVLALVLGYIFDNGVRVMADNALQVQQPLGIFEGFIMCTNHWYFLIVFCIGFIFLLTDNPRLSGDQLFIIYRTGKRQWFFGEVLQIAFCALAYILLLLAGCTAFCARYSFWGNVWSNFTVYYRPGYEELLSDNNRFVDQQVFKYYLPFQSAAHAVALLFLCLTLMGTVILYFSIINKKIVGILLNVILIVFVLIFYDYRAGVMWISPFCHAVLMLHNIFVYRQQSVPLIYSYLYLFACHAAVILLSLRALKKKAF